MATVWQLAGGMPVNIDHDAKLLARALRSAGFGTIFPQAFDGATRRHHPAELSRYLDAYRAERFSCGIWGQLRGEPEAEAELAHRVIGEVSARFAVFAAELEHKYTADDGRACGECFARGHRFIRRFRQLRPKFPIGLSSYGRFDQADIHYAAWLNEGNARALPQAYENEQGPSWAPALCFSGAIDVKQPHNPMRHPITGATILGFPKSYVHVTIAKPDPDDAYKLTIVDWIQRLRAAKAKGHPLGFSCYEIENYTAMEIAELGRAIRQYSLAALPT